MVGDARKNKVDADPAFKRRMAFVEDQVIQDYWLQREVAKRITPDKLQQRYQEKLKSMPAEEEVHARHILVADRSRRRRICWPSSRRARPFEKLAKEKSTDKASGAEGGDLGWFKRTDMVKEFADAAFALKKGELSEAPVKTPVRLPHHQGRGPPPGAAAERSRRWPSRSARNSPRETVTAFLDQLRSSAKIEKFNIDGSKADAGGRPQPATPAAPGTPAPALPPRQSKTPVLRVSGVVSGVRPQPETRRAARGNRWP